MTAPAAMTTATLTEKPVASTPVPRFELETWRQLGIRAGVTGRAGTFDLGLFADGRAGAVMEHWLAFEASQRPAFQSIAIARQVHGHTVRTYSEARGGWLMGDGLDGHVTNCRGLLLTATIADCIPIYLAHPASGTLALLHAGWRGTAAGVLETGIRTLISLAGCPADEIVMHCGVGICVNCYEVGPEVIQGVLGLSTPGPSRLDLRAALADRAARLGVRDITVSSWCSSHDMDLFFSHRRSRGSDGRMVAYLGVPASPAR